ncbi:hypothetical protein EDC01DRAFT_633680 [Geopyxis carbonaria]|nr:hypothetical protein EDC01DRAFT_633680 [Geopyxis carbonaria]
MQPPQIYNPTSPQFTPGHHSDLFTPQGRMHPELLDYIPQNHVGLVVRHPHTVRIFGVPEGLTLSQLSTQVRGGPAAHFRLVSGDALVTFLRPDSAAAYVRYIHAHFDLGRLSWYVGAGAPFADADGWVHSRVSLEPRTAPLYEDIAQVVWREGATRVVEIVGVVGVVDAEAVLRDVRALRVGVGKAEVGEGVVDVETEWGVVRVLMAGITIAVKVREVMAKMAVWRNAVFRWGWDPCDASLDELRERNFCIVDVPGQREEAQ